jgi:hypothetical protein
MYTVSARDFNQNTGEAKKAAAREPVFILDRGQPSHVLMSIAQYKALIGSNANIVDLLGMPGIGEIEFELPKRPKQPPRPAEFG